MSNGLGSKNTLEVFNVGSVWATKVFESDCGYVWLHVHKVLSLFEGGMGLDSKSTLVIFRWLWTTLFPTNGMGYKIEPRCPNSSGRTNITRRFHQLHFGGFLSFNTISFNATRGNMFLGHFIILSRTKLSKLLQFLPICHLEGRPGDTPKLE